MPTVLFVCTGNTCRSPMAQMFLQHKLKNANLQADFKVCSAGIYAQDNDSLSDKARNALVKKDIFVDEFCSTRLTKELLQSADMVFVMTKIHLKIVIDMYPEFKQKVHALAGDNDVCDPFGQSQQEYDVCLEQLQDLIDKVLPKIINLKKGD